MDRRLLALFTLAGTAVKALPQGVTSAISPSAPVPSGCRLDFPSTFGLAVVSAGQPVVGAGGPSGSPSGSPSSAPGPSAAGVATQSPDGQLGPKSSSITPTPTPTPTPQPPVAQISDGQIQRQTTPVPLPPVQQISDGQVQRQTTPVPLPPVQQISDGQVQRQTTPVPAPPVRPTAAPVQQISDGQVQRQTTIQPITQISDGQIQATYSPVTVKSTVVSAQAVTQISDAQPQAPTNPTLATSVTTSVYSTLVTKASASASAKSNARRQTQGSNTGLPAIACRSQSALTLTLNNGNLLDNQGRTGYIASNYQFQFDKPAQAGAIFTAGFSVCPSDGTLTLGDTRTFYQCLSGDFYNIYDRDFGAGQCKPVTLQAVELRDC